MKSPASKPAIAALIAGIAALTIVVLLGAVITLRGGPFGFDEVWMRVVSAHRSDLWLVSSLVMNFLGGGWFGTVLVPVGVTVVFLLLRRPWTAAYFLVASALSAALVQVLKGVFERARPIDVLVNVDAGSFPSGHVTNAATIAVVLGFILRRTWVWALGVAYVTLMALSRTYLDAHWVSDTVGGALLGASVAVVLWSFVGRRLHTEWPRPAR